MFICLDCERTFDEPEHYIETHGLDTPPYEHWDGCPYCGSAYTEAFECDCCGKIITGDYIKTEDGYRYCENCFVHYELGEED